MRKQGEAAPFFDPHEWNLTITCMNNLAWDANLCYSVNPSSALTDIDKGTNFITSVTTRVFTNRDKLN